jgi:hypothetical protein
MRSDTVTVGRKSEGFRVVRIAVGSFVRVGLANIFCTCELFFRREMNL